MVGARLWRLSCIAPVDEGGGWNAALQGRGYGTPGDAVIGVPPVVPACSFCPARFAVSVRVAADFATVYVTAPFAPTV